MSDPLEQVRQHQVSAESSNGSVRAYAALDGAGDLTLFLLNNSATQDLAATVGISGCEAAPTGSKWVLLPAGSAPAGAPQEAYEIQINGVTNPDPSTLPGPGVAQGGTNSLTVDLPPSAVVLVVLPPG